MMHWAMEQEKKKNSPGHVESSHITAGGFCSTCDSGADGTPPKGQYTMWITYRLCPAAFSFHAAAGRTPHCVLTSS
jgi:hypothetical protein